MSSDYFTNYNVKNFLTFKDELINLIINDGNGAAHDNIFKTDYYSKQKGPWFDLFSKEVLKDFSMWFMKVYKADQFVVEESWYQIYNKNNYHELHTHSGTNFTNIFYLQLPTDKTLTFIKDKNMDAKEGDLISFPGFVPHESKPNLHDKPKIIISFNSSLKINEK